jgi:hypothetical protein
MKAVISVLVLWTLSMLPGVGQTQTVNHSVLTVKVPFEFIVGNQTFPAGTYKFQSLLNSVAGKDAVEVLAVRGIEGRRYQAVVTEVVGAAEGNKSKIVFSRRDGRVFLSEVWEPGKQSGCRLRTDNRMQATENEDDTVILLASADWH